MPVEFLFFFKQKTAYEIRPRDWSSDVCSADTGDKAVDKVPESAPRRRLLGALENLLSPAWPKQKGHGARKGPEREEDVTGDEAGRIEDDLLQHVREAEEIGRAHV